MCHNWVIDTVSKLLPADLREKFKKYLDNILENYKNYKTKKYYAEVWYWIFLIGTPKVSARKIANLMKIIKGVMKGGYSWFIYQFCELTGKYRGLFPGLVEYDHKSGILTCNDMFLMKLVLLALGPEEHKPPMILDDKYLDVYHHFYNNNIKDASYKMYNNFLEELKRIKSLDELKKVVEGLSIRTFLDPNLLKEIEDFLETEGEKRDVAEFFEKISKIL